MAESSISKVLSCAQIGRGPTVAATRADATSTSAQDAVRPTMVPTLAHLLSPKIQTPLVAEEWQRALKGASLLEKYPQIPMFIMEGADAGIAPIYTTFSPPNHPSIKSHHLIFNEIVSTEFRKGRYWGPFSKDELESIIGPFQTSPLSLIPKLGKPGKFRLIQNLSYPRNLINGVRSVNSSIETDLYPCTWGTFSTTAIIVQSLPPGSLGACRDVSEAYRIIPLAKDQWPGVVVRIAEDSPAGSKPFALNTCTSFGKKSSGGLFGMFGDALSDIFRAAGVGPTLRWVDDFIFFLVLRKHVEEYNRLREEWRKRIEGKGGRLQKGGRFLFKGGTLPNDQPEEFAEDMSMPLRDLSRERNRGNEEYAYSMDDVDEISTRLGIPWERSKDIPFGQVTPFIGFDWDIENKTVSLQERKKGKYLQAVEEWMKRGTHTLADVQKLYGKLLHSCLVIPEGRAYLTKLESMLGIFHDTPFKPRCPPRHLDKDLFWWLRTLSKPSLAREIPGAREVIDVHAFSDASSSVGIGIVIGDHWRAWTLRPDWRRDGKDITWAEAVAMELLIRTVLRLDPGSKQFKVYGDNRGVVERWWSGRSRNSQTNEVFKRIHTNLRTHRCTVYTRYVPSAANPADGPSRGIFPSRAKLLPPVDLPEELKPDVFPLENPEHGFTTRRDGHRYHHAGKKPQLSPDETERRRDASSDLESIAWEAFEIKHAWEHIQ